MWYQTALKPICLFSGHWPHYMQTKYKECGNQQPRAWLLLQFISLRLTLQICLSIFHLFILGLADLFEILCKKQNNYYYYYYWWLWPAKNNWNILWNTQLKHTSMYLKILPKSLFLSVSAVTVVLRDSRSVWSAFTRASELICWTFISLT